MSRTDRVTPRKLCTGCPFCTPPDRAARDREADRYERAAEEDHRD